MDSVFTVMKSDGVGEVQQRAVEEMLGFELTRREYRALRAHRFDERMLKRVEDLTIPLLKRGVVSNKALLLQEDGIVVRNIQTGEEIIRRDLQSILDYQEAKEIIAKNIEDSQGQNIPSDLKGVMVKLVNNLISPNLTLNRQETNRRREVARTQVRPVFFPIEKGAILVRKGEPVTGEDLLKLEALYEGRGRGETLGIILGFVFFTCFFIASFYVFSTKNIRKVSPTNKDLLFLLLILISSLGMARISGVIAEGLMETFPGIPLNSYYYFFPVAAGAMLVRIVLNSDTPSLSASLPVFS